MPLQKIRDSAAVIMSSLLRIGCFLLVLAGMNIFSSCNYQFGHGELSQRYSTLSIPYVEGDLRGEMTAEIIKKLSTSGAFRYVDSNGDLKLKVKIIELSDENIGFRYDRKKNGGLKKFIIPTETRINVLVEVTLIDSKTEEILRGPTRISANADFDNSFYSSRNELNRFSLGQLNDIDAARDAVMQPLNRQVAERIVDYIINSW